MIMNAHLFVAGVFIVMIMNTHLFVAGVFIARGREDALVTKNLVPGESVYGEKRISVEVSRKYKKWCGLPLLPLKYEYW